MNPRTTLLLTVVGAVACAASAPPAGLAPVELVCVDPDARNHGATFQSHNQKVVSNARGIFMTHVRARNRDYTAQEWRLSWSRDGGRTFDPLCSDTHATSPGTLETDADGNVYMGRPDFEDRHAYLYRFLAREDYRVPHITRIPNGSGGKYAMMLDAPRRQLYWISHNRTFTRLDLEGRVLSAGNLIAADSKHATIGYPHLSLDGAGVLHAAWTTVMVPAPRPVQPIYWDIHYMQSPDGGRTWRTMAGAPVAIPVRADNSGPTDRLVLDDEYGVSNWLANQHVSEGKAHFLYLSQRHPPRQHYARYDLATHRREIDLQPKFAGQRLAIGGDGFFASRRAGGRTQLYCVAEDAGRIACLASDDNGTTWRDHAVSARLKRIYAIGGCREVTADGWIIGSFTEIIETEKERPEFAKAKVYFFRIRAAGPPAPASPRD